MRLLECTIATALGLAALHRDAFGQIRAVSPYQAMDSAVVVGPSNTVRVVRWVIVEFRRRSAERASHRRLDITYVTRIPLTDTAAVRQEADLAARAFGPSALRLGADGLALTVCNLTPCATPVPTTWIGYDWSNGRWHRLPAPRSVASERHRG